MYGTASKLGKMLMHIKWIVLAKENNFLLSRPVGLYLMHQWREKDCDQSLISSNEHSLRARKYCPLSKYAEYPR